MTLVLIVLIVYECSKHIEHDKLITLVTFIECNSLPDECSEGKREWGVDTDLSTQLIVHLVTETTRHFAG